MLEIQHLQRAYNGEPILQDVNLTVEKGEIVCLLGASGSGKTTLLRIIAGLEVADSGGLFLNGDPFTNIPVHKRAFGLMFQDYALFPHMTVSENVLFGMQMQRATAIEKSARLSEVLSLVGLDGFEKRNVEQLSGGERQRVALARSLAPRPHLLMLDEPLGSLDAALRERLVLDLRRIIKQIGLTAIYVTHDQREAFAIADRIAVIHAGRIVQVSEPHTLYYKPQNRYVAEFLGFRNIIPVLDHQNNCADTPLGQFPLTANSDYLLLHPDGLHLNPNGALHATITERVFSGDHYRLTVRYDDIFLSFKHPAYTESIPEVGESVNIQIESWAVRGISG